MAQEPSFILSLANCNHSVPISCFASYSDVFSAVVLLRKSIDGHTYVPFMNFQPLRGPPEPCPVSVAVLVQSTLPVVSDDETCTV